MPGELTCFAEKPAVAKVMVASRLAAATITLERVRQAHTIAEPARCETLHLTSAADARRFAAPSHLRTPTGGVDTPDNGDRTVPMSADRHG
jgi:hypothetical protein